MFLVLLVTGCGGGDGPDTTPPSTIADIQQVSKTRGTVTWTAPVDDGGIGAASSYDVRISEKAINNNLDFINATPVLNAPSPKVTGTPEQLTIPNLDINQTTYVAIRTTDDAGNQSQISSSFSFVSSQEETILNGPNNADKFGQTVSGGGDLNGDGIPDILVGSPSATQSKPGEVHVYYGGPIISGTSNVTLSGQIAGEQFGISLAGPGDMNGDGCSDIIIGANKSSSSLFTENGAVYIFYGSGLPPCPPAIPSVPNVTILGDGDGDEFGFTVTGIGDINGDDIQDFMVGAPFRNSKKGSVYIFLGGNFDPNLTANAANYIIDGEGQGDQFGFALSGGKDIDGDQVPDLAVGANQTNVPLNQSGAAYVFYGSSLGSGSASNANVKISGINSKDNFAWSLALMGDMSGDGLADLVVGTPIPNNQDNTGVVYIFYSDSSSGFVDKNASAADVTITGALSNDKFGFSLSEAGDVNLDGFSDLIVGAPQDSQKKGMAYLFYGNPLMLSSFDANSADVSLIGEGIFDFLGNSVAGIGDTNGDGYDEFVVGAPFNDNSSLMDNGAVYIYR